MLQHKGTQSIETQRLILRKFTVQDAQPMYNNWASDPEVTRFLAWPAHASPEISLAVIQSWIDGYGSDNFYQWAIVLKEYGDLPIGSISVVSLDEASQKAEIGYCIGRAWWHQGIMTEALQVVMDFLFNLVGVSLIQAHHDSRNPNSGAVMRKCGMQYEGIFPQTGRNNQGVCDIFRYTLSHEKRRKKVSLRRATIQNALMVWQMQIKAFSRLLETYQDHDTNPGSETLEKVQWRLEQPDSYYYFIYASGEIVGSIRVVDVGDSTVNKRISPLFILPEHRGRGFAQAAILEAERLHGSKNWVLSTILQEKGNCYLYEKMGYRFTGETKHINDRLTLVLYEK